MRALCDGLPSEDELREHQQQVHAAETEFRCSACDMTFPSQRELQEHAQKEHAV
jgi:uncharacterized C2H2 Zn-finger protein